jgi:HK97 family phage major capsid protein
MKKTLTIHAESRRAICSGPQLPLNMPAIGLRALAPRPMTFHEADKGISAAVAKAIEGETDPEKAAKKGLLTIAEQLDLMMKNYDQLDKQAKKLMEDFTAGKNNFDGLSGTVKGLDVTMQKFMLRMHAERRASFGSGVDRIKSDPEQRTLINALVRANFVKSGLVLSEKHVKALEEYKKALTEGSTPGSAWIVSELDANIYSTLQSYGIWNTLDVVNTGTKDHIIPVLTADPTANFIAEGAAITPDSAIAGTSVTATAKKIATIMQLSRELLQDSEYDVTGIALEQIMRATAKRADYAAFRADGTNDATNGAATGILNFGTSVVAPSGGTTVEALDYSDVLAVLLGTDVEVFNRGPRWWMHRFILFRMMSIRDNNGRPIFLTAIEAPSTGAMGSILGYPVTTGNIMPTTNSTGATVAAFGDTGAYHVGLRQMLEMLSSDLVYFTTDYTALRGIARMSFKGKLATALGLLTLG